MLKIILITLFCSFIISFNSAQSQFINTKNSISVYSGMGFFVDTKQESFYSATELFNNSVGYVFGGEYSFNVNKMFALDVGLNYMGTKSDKILGISSEINSFNIYVSPRIILPVGNIVKFGLSGGLGYSTLTDKITDDNNIGTSNSTSFSTTDNRGIFIPAFSFSIPVAQKLEFGVTINGTFPLNESESSIIVNGVETKFKRNVIAIGTLGKLIYNF